MNQTKTAVAALLLGVCLPARAQEPAGPVYTFVAFQDVPEARRQEYEAYRQKQVRSVLERMFADGTLLSWGLFTTVVRKPSGYTHGEWWTAAGVSKIERVRAELEKLGADGLSAKSRGYLFQAPLHRTKAASGSAYLWVDAAQTRPGTGERWRELWEKHAKPLYEDMLSSGTLVHYELEAEYVHTEEPGWRYVVTTLPDAEALDKADAARAAYERGHAEEARQEAEDLAEIVVPGTRRDYFARIEAYAQK